MPIIPGITEHEDFDATFGVDVTDTATPTVTDLATATEVTMMSSMAFIARLTPSLGVNDYTYDGPSDQDPPAESLDQLFLNMHPEDEVPLVGSAGGWFSAAESFLTDNLKPRWVTFARNAENAEKWIDVSTQQSGITFQDGLFYTFEIAHVLNDKLTAIFNKHVESQRFPDPTLTFFASCEVGPCDGKVTSAEMVTDLEKASEQESLDLHDRHGRTTRQIILRNTMREIICRGGDKKYTFVSESKACTYETVVTMVVDKPQTDPALTIESLMYGVWGE